MEYIAFSSIVQENGKTVRENNLTIPHKIPVGTAVYVKYGREHGNGMSECIEARLFVVRHDRDCDGTPLYALSSLTVDEVRYWLDNFQPMFARMAADIRGGFPEESLTQITVTPEMIYGSDTLAPR